MSDLTHESKSLIRRYLLSLFVVPASILTVGGFVLGWFINEAARGQAYADAYSDAQSTILSLGTSAAVSAERVAAAERSVDDATSEVDQTIARLAEISSRIEGYGNKLNTIEKVEEGLANEVALALLRQPDALTLAISGEYGSRMQSVEESLSSVWSQIRSLERESSRTSRLVNSKVRSGSTLKGATEWRAYQKDGIVVSVDTSAAGFLRTPVYTVGLAGKTSHWTVLGSSSIYNPTKDGFDVYIKQDGMTVDRANEWGLAINWIAVGD